jgi:hypothetical protein
MLNIVHNSLKQKKSIRITNGFFYIIPIYSIEYWIVTMHLNQL